MSEPKKPNGGGSATSAGTEYQAGIMSWLSVNILAGSSATPPFGLPADEKITSIRLESQDSIDDLVVGTCKARTILIQAKRGIKLETSTTSDLAKTLEQFTNQYIHSNEAGTFDETKDMYVLAAGDTASQTVHNTAANALNKIRRGANPEAFNEAEKKAYKAICDHIKRIWQDAKSAAIDTTVLAQILKVTYVQRIDVLDEGSDVQRAKDLLRRILEKPEHDGAAWSTLISEGLALARQKGEVTAASLEELFHKKVIPLKSPAEFENDIAQLRKNTEQTLRSMSRSSSIKLASKDIKVARTVVDELYRQVKAGESFIVVGAPGAGKSGALYEVLEKLKSDGTDLVAIATEKIEATSMGTLRNELGLENELSEVLSNWRGVSHGVLVIDALDAARDPHAADLFIDIAQSTLNLPNRRWLVIISIRKYDLRYNNKIKGVFQQKQISQFSDAEFNIAHINVPLFDNAEIGQLKRLSPELKGLIEKAGSEMEQLLRSPFNLSIAAEIMGSGVDSKDLTQVQSQLELLDRYWEVRVTDAGDKKGDARNSLIATALRVMVGQQSLKIGRQELMNKESSLSEQLDQLLSRNVLVEDKVTNLVGFNHHILYDYGIYRAVLKSGTDSFIRLIKSDPYLALSIRPSIQMYWQLKWQQDITRFAYWAEVMELEGDSEITKLAKIFGADFAVGVVTEEKDLEPLRDALIGTDHVMSEEAQAVFRRCSNAMAAAKKRNHDDGARHWVKIAEQALEKFIDYPMRLKACSILESAIEDGRLTSEQLDAAGKGMRRLLEVELLRDNPHTWIVRTSIKFIGLTYVTDPAATHELLGRLLKEDVVNKYGYIYLPAFADSAGELADKDAALVESLYDTAFSHEEEGNEVTSITNSQILGMTSNRKQDYDMVHFQLGRSYPEVISKDLPLALRILNTVLAKSTEGRRWSLSRPTQEASFDFEGEKARIIEDATYYWNEEISINNNAKETLDSFRQYMQQLAEDSSGGDRLKDALRVTASSNHAAVFWRTILQTAERHFDTLGMNLLQLLTSQALLTFDDTAHQASKFMTKVYPLLGEAKRKEIEDAITNIPASAKGKKHKERLERLRDSYILALDGAAFVTESIRTRRTDLDNAKAKEVFMKPSHMEAGWLSDEDMDQVLGKVPNPQNKILKDLAEKAQIPLGSFRSSDLQPEQAKELLALIGELKGALEVNTEADADWQDVIRDKIISAGSILVCSALYIPSSPEWPSLRENIVSGTGLESPVYDKESDEAFAEDGIVYGAAPRSSAAHALMAVANKEAGIQDVEAIHNLIRLMARDKMGVVRASIASEIHLIWKKDDTTFAWEIVEHFIDTETNPEVVKGLVHSLGRLRSVERKYVSAALVKLYSQWKGADDKTLRQTATINLAALFIDENDAAAKKELQTIVASPIKHYEELERAIVTFRERLVHGIEDPTDEGARAIRARATWLMGETLSTLTTALTTWKAKHKDGWASELTEEDKKEIRAIHGNIENIAMQIYFASGSFNEKNSKDGLGQSAKALFIKEQDELIRAVTETGDVKSAYEFVEMGLAYQDVDPTWSLKLVEAAVCTSVASGAANESLMASSIATFIKRFIARHRQYLQDKANQQRLMNILDEFVDVGWPEAINLTQDLEEIFR